MPHVKRLRASEREGASTLARKATITYDAGPMDQTCRPALFGIIATLALSGACAEPMVLGARPRPNAQQAQVAKGAQVAGAVAAEPLSMNGDVISAWGHTCVVDNGALACWGYDHFRQLGHVARETTSGGLGFASSPCSVSGLPPIRAVAAGESTTCAVDQKGDLWCWGSGSVGQLGRDPTTRCGNDLNAWLCTERPVRIEGIHDVRSVAVASHICAATAAGNVFCWGANEAGQLGTAGQGRCVPNLAPRRGDRGEPIASDALTCSRTPQQVEGLSSVTEVVAGREHTCALTADGYVFCWGDNSRGQLGIGKGSRADRPVRVEGVDGVIGLTAGMANTCVWRRDGAALCWGDNSSGQLGFEPADLCLTDLSCARTPGKLIGNVAEVGVRFTHGCARHLDGTVSCWGLDSDDQLGFSGADRCNKGRQTCAATPQKVPGITGATRLAVGDNFTCVVIGAGVQCWGRNALGNLGDGSTSTRRAPRPVVEARSCD